MKCRSLWQTPLATTLTSTSWSPGWSMSTDSVVSGWWGPWKMAAFTRTMVRADCAASSGRPGRDRRLDASQLGPRSDAFGDERRHRSARATGQKPQATHRATVRSQHEAMARAATKPAPADAPTQAAPVAQSTTPPANTTSRLAPRRAWTLMRSYPGPLLMLAGLLVSLALDAYRDGFGDPLALVIIIVGAAPLVRDTFAALRERRYALDYLALLAIGAAVAAMELQVGAVIALMLASGRALEDYGVRRARSSLSLLADRIPRTALVLRDHQQTTPLVIEEIAVGNEVLVRHGEVLPLDGELLSDRALVDESSLTGEPYLLDKVHGDEVRSGTVNQGPPLRIRVLREARDSTYRQILSLVEAAQEGSAPMARLADRYSIAFTAVAVVLAGAAWWYSGSLERALAVLVVATPCPLILGVPIALMGGVNRAARDKIIVKRLAGLEVLAKA